MSDKIIPQGLAFDMLRKMGGKYEDMAINITRKKYTACKKRSNLTLYKMKSGKFKIQDYHGKSYGILLDVDMAKKKYVELYEKTHGKIIDY